MALKIKTGETLTVSIETDDEDAAAALVAELQGLLKG
jgi:phosphotransferase system HPr-like phosphotransfer protein